jgi:hypothetical protein
LTAEKPKNKYGSQVEIFRRDFSGGLTMVRIHPLLLFFLLISGCANPYSKFYQDFTEGKNILEDPKVIISSGEPKLKREFDPNNDTKNMLEEGYCLIGQSCFNADSISQDAAVTQAKNVHADTVIIYNKYTHTVSGVRPLIMPNMQTGTAYHSGTIYGSGGGFANYSGSSHITTYGTSTTYVPFQIMRYDYLATYWVKIKPPRLGIVWGDLTDEIRSKIASNKGVYILCVIKDSPAFNNDLLTGDVIRRVNGIEVIDKNNFMKWFEETHPSVIDFEIFRNGENITKRVQLRSSDAATGAPDRILSPEETKIVSEEMNQQKDQGSSATNQSEKQSNYEPTKTNQKVSINKTSQEAPVENLGRYSGHKETCSICRKIIPKLEQHFMVDEKIVCKDCYAKSKSQKQVVKN